MLNFSCILFCFLSSSLHLMWVSLFFSVNDGSCVVFCLIWGSGFQGFCGFCLLVSTLIFQQHIDFSEVICNCELRSDRIQETLSGLAIGPALVPGSCTKGSELVVFVYPLSFLYKRITSCDKFHMMSLMMLVVFLIQLNWPQILSSCMKLFMLLKNVTRCFVYFHSSLC